MGVAWLTKPEEALAFSEVTKSKERKMKERNFDRGRQLPLNHSPLPKKVTYHH
jgi:hypothetical protein